MSICTRQYSVDREEKTKLWAAVGIGDPSIGDKGAHLFVVFASRRCFNTAAYINAPGRYSLKRAFYVGNCQTPSQEQTGGRLCNRGC